jgi:RNA polymerase II C-terminal domain phosphatase-like 3/4
MCIRCCALKTEAEADGASAGGGGLVPLSYLTRGLEVRSDVVAGHRAAEHARTLAARKLLLVLDLDHTLLNSARACDVRPQPASGGGGRAV